MSSKAGHILTLWLGFGPVTFFLIWGGTAYLIKHMSRRRRLEDVILFTQFLIPLVGFTIVSTVVFPPMPRLIAISIAPAAILAGRFVALPISFAEKKRRLGGAAKAYLPTVGLAALITITGITGSRAYIEFNGGYHEAAEKIGSLGKGGTYVQRNGHNWRIRFNKAVYTAGSWEELARLYHQKKVRYFPVDYASRHYIWEGSRCSRCLTPSGTCRL